MGRLNIRFTCTVSPDSEMLLRPLTACFLFALIFLVIPQGNAQAQTPDSSVPPGFTPVLADVGVQVFRKDYSQGSPDFVQVIDLSQGAVVKPLHGAITEQREGKGVYGGNDARFRYRSLQDYWREISSTHDRATCVTNGQFFYMPESPTRLPFPLKKDGVLLTDGYGIKDFPGQKLLLELWPGRADIKELTPEALATSDAPDIVAGLTEYAPKRIKRAVGRTFVGVDDRNGDGQHETVLIFSTSYALQSEAADVLRSFGADKVMMLDGGGSTQLSCRDTAYIYSERLIPQAIAVVAGPTDAQPPAPVSEAQLAQEAQAAPAVAETTAIPEPEPTPAPLSAAIIRQPTWLVVLEGESLQAEIELQNTGPEPWKAGEYQLVIDRNFWETDDTLAPQEEIQPSGKVVFSWVTPDLARPGVYAAKWYLKKGLERFPEQPVVFRVVVLPQSLQHKKPELEGNLSQWNNQEPANVEQQVLNWFQAQIEPPEEPEPVQESTTFNPLDLVWVPMAMLPVAGLALLGISRARFRSQRRYWGQ